MAKVKYDENGKRIFPDNWKFVIDPNARPRTVDETCRCFMGMSFESLVQDIIQNKDGKYDCIMANPAGRAG